MPVSGLVVTLAAEKAPVGFNAPDAEVAADPCANAPSHAAVIERIQQHPRFQVGTLEDNRLPVVIDTPDKQADKDCWAWLNSLPGVHHVDVAFIHFEDEDAFEHQACSANTQRLITAPTIGET